MSVEAFLLYRKSTSATGRALATELGIPAGRDPRKAPRCTKLIRWGNSTNRGLDEGASFVLNNSMNISDLSNRHHMFRNMQRRGVPGTLSVNFNPTWEYNGSWLLRDRYSFQGNDVVRPSNPAQFNAIMEDGRDLFAVEHWHGDYEVRVHIFQGRSILMQVKARSAETIADDRIEDETPAPGVLIRNRSNGWNLYPLTTGVARDVGIDRRILRNAAKDAASRMGIDFCAVDFLVRPGPNLRYRILELNSAPGLSGQSLNRYTTAMTTWLRTVVDETEEDDEPVDSAAGPQAELAFDESPATPPWTFQNPVDSTPSDRWNDAATTYRVSLRDEATRLRNDLDI